MQTKTGYQAPLYTTEAGHAHLKVIHHLCHQSHVHNNHCQGGESRDFGFDTLHGCNGNFFFVMIEIFSLYSGNHIIYR